MGTSSSTVRSIQQKHDAGKTSMSGAPAAEESKLFDHDDDQVISLMMPIYYTVDLATSAEFEMANNCWNLILSNGAPGFLAMRRDPSFKYSTSISYFYRTFYIRLFDIHPGCRELFKDINSQGKFLVKMITLSLSEKKDSDKYDRTLQTLTDVHNQRGVKAVEYGLVGDVLFWSLKHLVGCEIYCEEMHQAWVKIYSRMLSIMVPLAVKYELLDNPVNKRLFSVTTMPTFDKTSSAEFANFSISSFASDSK